VLRPYAEEVRARYQTWLTERDAAHRFTSLRIVPDDFDVGWFGHHGSLGKAHALFGDQLTPLLAELNEVLAA
jgi:type I restriction enzyme R subunit